MKLPKGVNGATSLPLTDVCDSARWTSILDNQRLRSNAEA